MTDSEIKQYLNELVEKLITSYQITPEEANELIKRSDTENLIREDDNFTSSMSTTFWAEMLYILHKKQ